MSELIDIVRAASPYKEKRTDKQKEKERKAAMAEQKKLMRERYTLSKLKKDIKHAYKKDRLYMGSVAAGTAIAAPHLFAAAVQTGESAFVPFVTEIASATAPYALPLLAVTLTPVLAADALHGRGSKVKDFLKKEYGLLEHEAQEAIEHFKGIAKHHPRYVSQTKAHSMNKLKKVM
jgi:hypothetical protein